MNVHVSDNKLRKAVESEAECKRRYGVEMAKKLMLRLGALRAAESLFDFWPPKSGPERCHQLQGDLAGVFSVDLKQPYRLLFRPGAATLTENEAEEQGRWKSITSIEILAIEDTHG